MVVDASPDRDFVVEVQAMVWLVVVKLRHSVVVPSDMLQERSHSWA